MGGARRGCSTGGGWGRRGRGGSGGSASLARSDGQLRMGLRAYLIRYFAATSDSRQYSTSAAGAFPPHDATPREYLESHSESRKKNPFVSKLLSSWAHEPATSASPISPPTTYAPQHSSTTLVAQSFVCAPSMV